MFARVRRHLVLEQEGEVAALADAVEVAVHLVVLTPCKERGAANDRRLVYLWRARPARAGRQHQTKL